MIYYFIADLIELDPLTELEICENVTIKNIPAEVLPALKSLIKQYHPHDRSLSFDIPRNDFDNLFHEYKVTKELPSGGIRKALRNSSDFRYFVLEDSIADKFKLVYPKAFALCDKDFFIPFSFSLNSNLVIKSSFNELCLYTYYNDINRIDKYWIEKEIPFKRPKDFLQTDKEQIEQYINLLDEFEIVKSDYPYIDKALNDFFLIFELSDYSVFKIVSYIACLELLLVDGSPDRLKSINSQLQTKLNLLNNQFEDPIKIGDFIKGPDTLTLGKVIEVIYTYRSLVAHGDFIDFSKKLNILENINKYDILNFVRVVLKKVIVYSLKNPNLIRDLKKC